MNRLQIADVLDRAAVEVERRGLYKGDFAAWHLNDGLFKVSDGPDGPCCAAGVINLVVNGDPFTTREHDDLTVKEALLEYFGIDLVDEDDKFLPHEDYDDRIAKWNDAEERTAEQVVDTFHAAAAHLREQT